MTPEPCHPPTRVHDLWARLLLSAVLGLLVPAVSGLVDPQRHSWRRLAFSYVAFTAIAFLIWEGDRRCTPACRAARTGCAGPGIARASWSR